MKERVSLFKKRLLLVLVGRSHNLVTKIQFGFFYIFLYQIHFTKFLDSGIQDVSTSISIVDKLPKGVMMMMVMKVTHM